MNIKKKKLRSSGLILPSTSFPYIYYFVSENKTWEAAQTYCMSRYTALAQINNAENLTAMMSIPTWGYTNKAWIGLNATLNWTWVDGQEAMYFKWMVGQPDDSNTNNLCVKILAGFWFSVSCSQMMKPVCFDGGYIGLLLLRKITTLMIKANQLHETEQIQVLNHHVTVTISSENFHCIYASSQQEPS